jgi:hypothetical protein
MSIGKAISEAVGGFKDRCSRGYRGAGATLLLGASPDAVAEPQPSAVNNSVAADSNESAQEEEDLTRWQQY